MVDGRYSILVELSALSAGKTLVVDDLTEHLEMPILFLAFNFNLAWILGFDFALSSSKDTIISSHIIQDEVGHPPSIPSRCNHLSLFANLHCHSVAIIFSLRRFLQ